MKKLHLTFFGKRNDKKFILILIALLFSLAAVAQTDCTQDMYSSDNLMKMRRPGDSTILPQQGDLPTYPPFQLYDPCANQDSNLRAVGYIHGLGGNIAAWDKQIQFTDSAYPVASFGVDYGSGNYEVSLFQVGQRVQQQLKDGFENAD